MAADFIHSVLIEEQDPAADGVFEHGLGVNPLSGLLLELKPLNETSTLTNFAGPGRVLDALSSLRVVWRGQTVLDASGRDYWMALLHRWRVTITQNNDVNTDNDRRSLILPILFGRHWGDREEGIPATKSGELVVRVELDVADTGYDDLRYQIEALELPGANFRRFTRVTTIPQTFAATGHNDVVLPVGNPYRGILCFATTEFAGPTPAPSFGRIAILRDGIERGYTSTDWERLRALYGALGKPHPRHDHHLHVIEGTGAAGDDTSEPEQIEQEFDEFAYLDFDFLRDDTYLLETRGANRMVLRADAETADAVRVLPIERVEVAEFFGGPRP